MTGKIENINDDTQPVKIIAVADSDSYVKFAAATLHALPDGFDSSLVLVNSPIAPSFEQVQSALAGTRFAPVANHIVPALTMPQLRKRLRQENPDVVFLSGTGPVIEVVAELCERLDSPPALISSIPGMALPARFKGIEYRARVHALIMHSHKEVREYSSLLAERSVSKEVVLGSLPFLPAFSGSDDRPLESVVFTPQALVPSSASQRASILMALQECARRNPGVQVVVKLRARSGENQTHNEQFAYDALWEAMCASNTELVSSALNFATGPLSDFLVPGSAHVTVSSTAALESIAAGVPTLVLEDFGVNERLLNAVYVESGCLGNLSDLTDLRFGIPNEQWLTQNYFHPEDSLLPHTLRRLASMAQGGTLRRHQPLNNKKRYQRLIKNWLRSTLPTPLLASVGRLRRAFRVSVLR